MHVKLIVRKKNQPEDEDHLQERRERDELRELRGSTFSLAFVLAFTVVSR